MKKVILSICLALWSAPVAAQSSLGIQGLDLQFGQVEDETGTFRTDALARIDVAITEHHGFQGDVSFADTNQGLIGLLGTHLYLTPRAGQKYGLFASLSDLDGRAMTWGSLGVEGMLSLSEGVTFEARTGLGVSDVDSLDYIFADMSFVFAASETVNIETGLTVAEFDEASFQAISYEASITARYSREGAPWGVFAQISQAGLSGRDDAPGETRIGLGVTISLGQSGGISPENRPFRTVDPVAPLIRRNLW